MSWARKEWIWGTALEERRDKYRDNSRRSIGEAYEARIEAFVDVVCPEEVVSAKTLSSAASFK